MRERIAKKLSQSGCTNIIFHDKIFVCYDSGQI